MKKGLIITVNYNSYHETINYIQSLSSVSRFKEMDMIIVDNNSHNLIVKKIEKYIKNSEFKNINLICSGSNLGYFGAVRYAIDRTVRNIENYELIIVSNNDILIKDVDFFSNVFNKISDAFVIAPRIISLIDNHDQNPFRETKITPKQEIFWNLYFSNYHLAKILIIMKLLLRLIFRQNIDVDSERNIYAGHGAFLIFSKEYFKKGGYIDNGFFLYAEENTVAAITERINGSIKYCPSLIVYHSEHQTVGQKLTKQKYQIQKRANQYFSKAYRK